jgi:YidC/Oxa1 family membrane protein insertase
MILKRLQVEMMRSLQNSEVNPLGGCLPLLFQLPIFWALFTTLRKRIRTKICRMDFWVKDLSASDSLMHFAGLTLI